MQGREATWLSQQSPYDSTNTTGSIRVLSIPMDARGAAYLLRSKTTPATELEDDSQLQESWYLPRQFIG